MGRAGTYLRYLLIIGICAGAIGGCVFSNGCATKSDVVIEHRPPTYSDE